MPTDNAAHILLLRIKADAVDLSHLSSSLADVSADGHRTQVDFPCGLAIAIEADRKRDCLQVYASHLEIEHVLQHLFLREPPLWRADADGEQAQQHNSTYSIFRQDNAGNVFPVYNSLCEREAHCIAQLFEQRGHKQTYWVEKRSR